MFPLLIGASVGPEAGLTGVIVGLCCWVGDKLKRYYNEAHDLAAIGASASLATIFRSPMFGFVEPLEGEADAKLPKAPKTVLYILAILSSFGIFILLNRLTGGGTGFPSVQCGSVAPLQYGWAIVLTIVGVAMGVIFLAFEKLTRLMLGPVKNVVVRCVIGGLALGGIGTLLLPSSARAHRGRTAACMSTKTRSNDSIRIIPIIGLFCLSIKLSLTL